MSQEALKSRLDKLGRLEAQLHGGQFEVCLDYQKLTEFLHTTPAQAVYVELPWYEQIGDQTYTYNQVIVQSISSDQVHFLNPLPQSDITPGARGGNGLGPERQVLADGSECMDTALFQRLFRLAGGALLPTP